MKSRDHHHHRSRCSSNAGLQTPSGSVERDRAIITRDSELFAYGKSIRRDGLPLQSPNFRRGIVCRYARSLSDIPELDHFVCSATSGLSDLALYTLTFGELETGE